MPPEVLDVVSLGPNFNVKSGLKENDIVVTIKNLESLLNRLEIDPEEKQSIRSSIVHTLKYNLKNKIRRSPTERQLSSKLVQTHAFLKNNPNIFITKADKGNITVCLKKTEYVLKMTALLSD